MARILFITLSPIQSASERHRIYQFLPCLERAGFACTVQPFATRALHRAIQAERLALKILYTPYCYARRIVELTTVSRYDAIVVHRGIFPFLWPAVEKMVIHRHSRLIFDFD